MTNDKAAIVTGASQGIGYALVKELAQYMPVHMVARREPVLIDAKKTLQPQVKHPLHTMVGDVTVAGPVEDLVDSLLTKEGVKELIFVNNGGAFKEFFYDKQKDSYAMYEKQRAVHQDAPIRYMMHFTENYSGKDVIIRVVNINSHSAARTLGIGQVYAPFKGAVVKYTNEQMKDFTQKNQHNITLTNVLASSIGTEKTKKLIESGKFTMDYLPTDVMARATVDSVLHRNEGDFFIGNVDEPIPEFGLKGDEGYTLLTLDTANPTYVGKERRSLK